MEEERLESLPIGLRCQKMERDFDHKNEKECFKCFYDLHLSAATCICSPEKFACPRHANTICSCEISNKFILVRYSIGELQQLVKALEGDLDALRVWSSNDYIKDHVNDNKKCSELPVEKNDPDLQNQKLSKEEGFSVCFPAVDISLGNNDLKENYDAMCTEQQSSPPEAAQPPNYFRDSASRGGMTCSVSCHDICVEVLTVGRPVSGKLWCTKNVIFPKGNWHFTCVHIQTQS